LQVQESHLRFTRFEKIAQLIIKNKDATVIRMLEPLFRDIFVDRSGDERSGDEFAFFNTEKLTELWGDFLFAVKSIVLRAVCGFFAGWVILLCLDLADKLTQGLDLRAESGDFGENVFDRHGWFYNLLMRFVFKFVSSTV